MAIYPNVKAYGLKPLVPVVKEPTPYPTAWESPADAGGEIGNAPALAGVGPPAGGSPGLESSYLPETVGYVSAADQALLDCAAFGESSFSVVKPSPAPKQQAPISEIVREWFAAVLAEMPDRQHYAPEAWIEDHLPQLIEKLTK